MNIQQIITFIHIEDNETLQCKEKENTSINFEQETLTERERERGKKEYTEKIKEMETSKVVVVSDLGKTYNKMFCTNTDKTACLMI